MLHAIIRSERDTFHFFGEVSGYNLETLRHHVRDSARDAEALHLRVEVDPGEREMFTRHAGRWLRRLARAGTTVEVVTH